MRSRRPTWLQRFKMSALLPAAALMPLSLSAVAQSPKDLRGAISPSTVPGSSPAPLKLTIDQAVALGLKNSKPLGIAAEAVERARGRVSEQRAGFNPSVGATATFTHLDEGSSFTIPDENGNPVTIPIIKQNQKQVQIQGNLPLDIFGLISAAVQQQQ